MLQMKLLIVLDQSYLKLPKLLSQTFCKEKEKHAIFLNSFINIKPRTYSFQLQYPMVVQNLHDESDANNWIEDSLFFLQIFHKFSQ